MKLLTPTSGKSLRDIENSRQELRSQQLDTVIRDKRKEIDSLEQLALRTLSEQGQKNYEDEQAWTARIKQLTDEVEQLEKRKERALLPIKERETQLLQGEQALVTRATLLDSRETDLNEGVKRLNSSIDEVQRREMWSERRKNELDNREIGVIDLEKQAELRLIGVEQQYEETQEKESKSRERVSQLTTETEKLRKERGVLLIPLEERERQLDARTATINLREESIIKREVALKEGEKHLASRLATLERTEAEVEAKSTTLKATEARLAAKDEQLQVQAQKQEEKHHKADSSLTQRAVELTQKEQELKIVEQEVTRLQKEGLVPLEKKEKELTIKNRVLLEREEKIAIKETDLEATSDALTERLDDLSEREQHSQEYAKKLENRNANLTLQEKEIQTRQDALVVILRETSEAKQKNENDLANQYALIKGREVVLNEREGIVLKKEKGFANREKAIQDKYLTLQKAISEMKLKYGDKLNIKL